MIRSYLFSFLIGLGVPAIAQDSAPPPEVRTIDQAPNPAGANNRSLKNVTDAEVIQGCRGRPATEKAMTQDRMPEIPADKLTEAQKKAADEFAAGRGTPVFGPFVPLLRSPEVMLRAKAMGDYLRFKTALPPKLNEFAILITARQRQSSPDALFAPEPPDQPQRGGILLALERSRGGRQEKGAI